MAYVTQALPIQFWLQLQIRLQEDNLLGRASLHACRTATVQAGIDDAQLKVQQMSRARDTALATLRRLEDLAVLRMSVGNQLLYARMQLQLPTLESRIAYYQDLVVLFEEAVGGLPSRQIGEEALNDLQRQYSELRGGDQVQASRARLGAFRVDLRVLGSEDASSYTAAIQNLKSMVDQLKAELQGIQATNMISLTIQDEVAPLMQEFGVQLSAEDAEVVAPQAAESPVGEPGGAAQPDAGQPA